MARPRVILDRPMAGFSSQRRVQQVTPSGRLHVRADACGVWRVQWEGEDRPLSEHGSETEAERAAARHAMEAGAPEIVVHDRYHRVRRG